MLSHQKYGILYIENIRKEVHVMKRSRNRFSYKVKMWFYNLTIKDIKKFIFLISNYIFESITAIIIFLFIILFPAFFH